jgi:HAD superfamily hydrolase (TIGR01509 family)
MNKITTIIFDFGDVLIEDLVNVFEHKHHYSSLPKKLKQRYDKILHLAETGKTSTGKYLKATSDILAPKLSPRQIENYFLSGKPLPPIKLLSSLEKKYRLAILSNNQKAWPKKFITKSHLKPLKNIPFFNSAKIGLRKPHKEIYLFALNKLNAKPRECIFIDDKPENIQPAKALGIKTILYRQNLNELKQKLKKLGI